MNDVARRLGFTDAEELHRLVASADIATAESRAAFVRWQRSDGTKAGLVALAERARGE